MLLLQNCSNIWTYLKFQWIFGFSLSVKQKPKILHGTLLCKPVKPDVWSRQGAQRLHEWWGAFSVSLQRSLRPLITLKRILHSTSFTCTLSHWRLHSFHAYILLIPTWRDAGARQGPETELFNLAGMRAPSSGLRCSAHHSCSHASENLKHQSRLIKQIKVWIWWK